MPKQHGSSISYSDIQYPGASLDRNLLLESGFAPNGTYTPESSTTYAQHPHQVFGSGQFQRSMTPQGPQGQHSRHAPSRSFYSAGATPPVIPGAENYAQQPPGSRGSDHAAALQARLRNLHVEYHNQSGRMLSQPYPNQPLQLLSNQMPYYQRPVYAQNGFYPPQGMAFPANVPMVNPMPLGNVTAMQSPIVQNGQGFQMQPQEVMTPNGSREISRHLQSNFLVEFRAAKDKKKYDLRALQGHIVEFCGDQVGSRHIQNKIMEANSEEKTLVFNEILPNARQLMHDVFGNYVIQKFFEHGDQVQKKSLAREMKGNVYYMSTATYACRVVQTALQFILLDQQVELVSELEPHIHDCVQDQNGNHVIQKAIEFIPLDRISFIVNYCLANLSRLAVHSYGCRIVQRLLERCSDQIIMSKVLKELVSCGANLIKDQFGNYVAQHMIVYGDHVSRNEIISLVLLDVPGYATHKFASNVVEKCISSGTPAQRRAIMTKLLESKDDNSEGLVKYVKCPYANYVIRK
jgi:mRNA-binding protein PUF3